MILCIGEAVIDMIRFPVKDIQAAFLPLPGGCAYNTSIAIGRLGVPVAFLGRLSANFFGDIQVKRLRENNVKDNLLIRCPENPVLSFIKIEEGKDPEYAFYEEGTADRLLLPQELPALTSDISCIVFGSISIAMEPIGSTIEALVLKESSPVGAHICTHTGEGKVIAFDPNIRPLIIKDKEAYKRRFDKLAGASTIIKISIEDFQFLEKDAQPLYILEKLITLGSRLAIVTLGPKGAMALLKRTDGSTTKISAPGENVPQVADTVGAGDTFHGAFLARLEQRGKMSPAAIVNLSETELHEALTFANKAAAYVCAQHGCEPPWLKEIQGL